MVVAHSHIGLIVTTLDRHSNTIPDYGPESTNWLYMRHYYAEIALLPKKSVRYSKQEEIYNQ
ncbi:MAG: hypothetical protein ACRC38_02740, partial [Plesiomonas sp.]